MSNRIMNERTSQTSLSPETGGSKAIEWPVVTALVVDVAGASESHESQDAITDFIWHMLERDYQIYLCSSTPKAHSADGLAAEDFADPHLTWLIGETPPSAADMAKHPALAGPNTLWISDDPGIRRWAIECHAPYVSLKDKSASFAESLHVGSWGELGRLLDPTAHAAQQVAEAIAGVRQIRPHGAIVVGLGGPPESGYERFAVELKRILEANDAPLVELLDISPLFPEGSTEPISATALPKDSAAQWVSETILQPLAKGERIFVEKAPGFVPEGFRGVFPLFISEESVVLVLGETALHRAFRDHMQLAILIEVSPAETARRLYEVPDGESFDEALVKQYLEHDGRAYAQYLKANQVVERADLRLNGSSPRRFDLVQGASLAN